MPEPKTCGVCGALTTLAFCPHCGAPVERASSTADAGPDSKASPEAKPGSNRKSSSGFDTQVANPELPDPAAGLTRGESTTLFQPRLLGEEGDADLGAPADLCYVAPQDDPQERIPLFGERTTFGRHGADVNLPDPALASPHFAVERTAGAYFLSDLDSASGTYLNDRKVRSCELAPEDVIRAGTTRLLFLQDTTSGGG